jgi:hypothetical protein
MAVAQRTEPELPAPLGPRHADEHERERGDRQAPEYEERPRRESRETQEFAVAGAPPHTAPVPQRVDPS